MWRTSLATLVVLASAARVDADPVAASAPPPSPATSLQGAAASTAPTASASASMPADGAEKPHGLALGIELGEPASATFAFFKDKLALEGAIGSGTLAGPGIQLHADAQLEVSRLSPSVPVRVGLGARFYHHGYDPASIDEIPHEHYGVRASLAIAMQKKSMELYAEVAPGIDFKRTNACALTNGAYSICPHQQDTPLFLQLVVGARFFLSH